MLDSKKDHIRVWGLLALAVSGALFLRAWGIHWGVPSTSIPHRAFHPDEWWAMMVMQQMNLEAWDFNPEEAHREGPVCYYFWFFLSVLAQKLGFLSHLPYQTPSEGDEYARCLLLGRWVVAILDSVSVVPLFFAVKNLTKKLSPALIAALIFAICPFEIIYGRYMRTHAPANFFVCLIFWYCSIPQEKRSRYWEVFSGVLCGLSATIRYPTGAAIIIPGLILLREEWQRIGIQTQEHPFQRLQQVFLSKKLWVLAGSFLLSILLSAPHIITDFWGVLPHIQYQASFAKTEEFGLLQIFQLQRILPYFTFLLPYGLFPLLWVPVYLATAYLLWTRAYARFTGPVAAFLFVYFYGMAKGYLANEPEFVRAIMPLFPGCALFVGLALGHLFETYRNPLVFRVTLLLFVGLMVPSVIFDSKYSTALSRNDVRIQVFQYLEKTGNARPIRVGVPPSDKNTFLTTPVLGKFPQDRFVIDERPSLGKDPRDLDFVLLTKFGKNGAETIKHQIASLKSSGNFQFVKKFRNPLVFFGKTLSSDRLPHDMSYPFPEFYLFRRVR